MGPRMRRRGHAGGSSVVGKNGEGGNSGRRPGNPPLRVGRSACGGTEGFSPPSQAGPAPTAGELHADESFLGRDWNGSRRAVPRLDQPPGVYTLRFVLGGPAEETWARVAAGGVARQSEEPLLPGRWATPVRAVSLQEAGSVEVVFEAGEGKRWLCSGLFVRKM